MDVVVGIGEYAVSADPDDVLVTYSLGSCLGLAVHDARTGAAALLHAQMPVSRADPERALRSPGTYVDTGVAAVLSELFALGASRSTLVVRVAGAGSSFSAGDPFRIGERNHTVLRRVLWKNGILIASEDVGGPDSRTLSLEVGSGRAFVKARSETREL